MISRQKLHYSPIIIATVLAVLLLLAMAVSAYAGDPDEIIGPTDLFLYECVAPDDDDDDNSNNASSEEIELEFELARERIVRNSIGDYPQDLFDLIDACEDAGGELRKIHETKIEGYVYEFHPVDPENPATSEWFAVPSKDVPVIAEGVTFEIFWGSEPDGYFYFYKTRFGQGPIVLNLRLPRDAHPLNPNILIESTGLDETWTVFLGFYRGDIPPPNIDQLKAPNGSFLPFGNNKFNSIVGLDGKSALPGVGGVKARQVSVPVMALAAIMAITLPIVGITALRRKRSDMPPN